MTGPPACSLSRRRNTKRRPPDAAQTECKTLQKAQAALSDTQAKLVDLRSRREAALLDDDDPGPVIALDQEIAKLERIGQVQQDRIEALKRKPSARQDSRGRSAAAS